VAPHIYEAREEAEEHLRDLGQAAGLSHMTFS
jgi:hypothetical protein